MKSEEQQVGTQRPAARRGRPAGHAVRAVAVCYLALTLLNAGALQRSVERLPYGPARTLGLRVTGPLLSFSRALGLTALRTAVERVPRRLGWES
jgi:hypothetical protein